jgi:purine nucleosidase
MSKRIRVVLDHDGQDDELVAQVVLGAARQYHRENDNRAFPLPIVDLVGVICIDGDCYIDPAMDLVLRLATLCRLARCNAGGEVVQVGRSSLKRGGPADYPAPFRAECIHMQHFTCMNSDVVNEAIASRQYAILRTDVTGEELLAELVMKSPEPVTVCVTGPMSNVAYCLTKYGEAFASKVERLVIMGGAFGCKGNVASDQVPGTHVPYDGSQEWNVFWDPKAADTVVSTPLLRPDQKIFFDLEMCRQVPVLPEFVRRFGQVTTRPGGLHPTQLACFIGNANSMCTLRPPYTPFSAWDSLTASFILDPRVVSMLEPKRIKVVTDNSLPNVGQTCVLPDNAPEGSFITHAKIAATQLYYDVVVSVAGAV